MSMKTLHATASAAAVVLGIIAGMAGTALLGAGTAHATAGQDNAIRKAESYLSHMGFSRQGLIEQLEYNEYSTAEATYAVDHVTVDWNAEAVEKAQSYLSHMAFSRSGLVEQLEYNGFTPAQAQYGADTAYGS